MQNFTFHNPTKIMFGEGQIAALDARVPREARVLITEGSEEERVTAAITATRVFFERMTVGTRLRDYQIGGSSIGTLIAKLEEHGMTALGEHGDVTPEVSRQVYQPAV